MKRILFVDDDPRILSGLRRQLRSRRGEWEMIFAPGGAEALMELGSQKLDAVVTDMCMPVVDGAQVLAHVAHDCPRAARLVLSGDAADDRKRLAKSCAHRYLHKPCPADVLEMEIEHALAMREVLDALGDERCEQIWSRPPGFMDECEAALDALMLDAPSVTKPVLAMLGADDLLRARVAQSAAGLSAEVVRLDASAAQLAGAMGPECFLSTIMAIRFLDTFTDDAEVRWPVAVQLATTAASVARENELEAEAQTDAFVAGLLQHLVDDGQDRRRLDLLAYLLPTWGLRLGVVDALTAAPNRVDASETAKPDAGSALLAARCAHGDPRADELQRHIAALGWTSPPPADMAQA